jgi:translation initiation factor 2 alpha subunit (eIF-2alpha)
VIRKQKVHLNCWKNVDEAEKFLRIVSKHLKKSLECNFSNFEGIGSKRRKRGWES